MNHRRALLLLLCTFLCATGCATHASAVNAPGPASPSPSQPQFPTGPVGEQARYGRELFNNTPHLMKAFVGAQLSCSACHLQSGTKARALSLIGVSARFPQYNRRAHRVITIEDRIAECFLYSMNGRPPAYQSKEMVAIVAYFAYLSAGTKIGTPQATSARSDVSAPAAPDRKRGAALYSQKCVMCHQQNGAGVPGQLPPLWGPTSFNDGAGMHHIETMAGFVKYNMPLGAGGSLSAQEAYDISAFVLSHPRPVFNKNAYVSFPPQRAVYF